MLRHLKMEIQTMLMSFRIDDEKLLEKYIGIWTKIKDLKNIELNAFPVYDDRYIKTRIRTHGDKVYSNFRGLIIECKSFTVISKDSLFVFENKYYLQVYLDNCTYKIANRQITDYLDDSLFED